MRVPSTDSRRKHSPSNCSLRDEKMETGSSLSLSSIDTLVVSGLPSWDGPAASVTRPK